MAATNYTPIQLYHSTTASAVPVNTNLVNGELAINITDGKLYYKDNGGTVQVIATKATGTIGGSDTQVQYNSSGALAGSSNFTFNGTTATINTLNLTNALGATYGGTAQSSWTTGDLLYASGSNTLAKLGIGLNTYILTSNGTIPGWAAPSAISVNTATNLAGGAAGSVPYQSGAGATTFLSIGTANQVVTSTGSAPQWSSGLSITTLTASDAVTFSATTQNIALGTSQTSGTFTVGGTAQTGNIAIDRSTKTHTLNIGTGITESGQTKTINIGTAGDTGSTTAITIGSTNGTTVTVNGTVNATTVNVTTLDLTNLEVTNIKAKDGTAAMSIADSTGVVSITANPVLSGGTANGVPYLNGSKVLTTGSALTFDGTNFATTGIANIGNGARIQGSGSITGTGVGAEIFASGGVTYYTSYDRTGAAYAPLQYISGSYQLWNVGGEQMRLTSTGLGIGETNPATKLDVAGNATVQNGVLTVGKDTIYDAFINTPESMYFNVDSDANSSGNKFTWGADRAGTTGGTTWMTLDSSGNLGIGDTNPGQKLAVIGVSANLYNSSIRVNSTTGTQSANSGLWLSGNQSTSHYNWLLASQYNLNAAFEITPSTAVDGATFSNPVYAVTNAGLHKWYNGTTQAMTLDASGRLLVGPTSATAGGGLLQIGQVPNGTSSSIGFNNADNAVISARYSMVFQNDSDNNIGSRDFVWKKGGKGYSDGTTLMTLDASGNLGVGATSPQVKLQVSEDSQFGGRLRLENQRTATFDGDSFGLIQFYGNDASSGASGVRGQIEARCRDVSGATDLLFSTAPSAGAVAERARITSGGQFAMTNDGTNAAPAISFTNDLDTGIFRPTTNQLGFATAGVQAMTLDALGNLLVGQTSKTTGATAGANLGVTSGITVTNGSYGGYIEGVNSSGTTYGYLSFGSSYNAFNAGEVGLGTSGALPLQFATNNTEKARITSGGDFLVGTTNDSGTAGAGFKTLSGRPVVVNAASANTTTIYEAYSTGAADYRFYVGLGGTVYATNTTISAISDQRLKENIRDLDVGLNAVLALKPRKFDWKTGKGADKKDVRGFIAQEFEQVFPDLIDEWKSPAPEGEEPYKSVRADLIPVLVKAIQEQQAMINELKAEVAALKGA